MGTNLVLFVKSKVGKKEARGDDESFIVKGILRKWPLPVKEFVLVL